MKRLILTGLLVSATGLWPVLAQQGQQAKGGQPQQMVPNTKSAGESAAVMALFQAQQANNMDGVIKGAEDLLTKYTDTFYKEAALTMEAMAYQQKGDSINAQIYFEKLLEFNPKSLQAMLSLGEILATKTRENDLDREEKFTKATKYLNDTMEQLKTAPKPNPQITDAQWEEGKKAYTAEAHNDLGLMALTRKKYDVAITEFKSAVDTNPEPAYQVRLASAYQNAGKNDEAIAICDKLLADPQLHPTIKQVAQAVKAAASQGKK